MRQQELAMELHIPRDPALPDDEQWRFKFEIPSATSSNVYVVSQNIKGKFWGCSCPGWRTHRHCKHLDAIGLPGYEIPYEPNIIEV